MTTREFIPQKLDVEAFARDAAHLQGEWPAASLTRLAESAPEDAPASDWPAVHWELTGERREARGAEAQTWLHLQARALVSLTCQRCLQPVQEELGLSRWFRFVRDENLATTMAAELDADSDDEVLALPKALDALELVEDELLLALPLVPRHETCPQPLPLAQAAPTDGEDRPHPFAALAALKGKPGDGSAQ